MRVARSFVQNSVTKKVDKTEKVQVGTQQSEKMLLVVDIKLATWRIVRLFIRIVRTTVGNIEFPLISTEADLAYVSHHRPHQWRPSSFLLFNLKHSHKRAIELV